MYDSSLHLDRRSLPPMRNHDNDSIAPASKTSTLREVLMDQLCVVQKMLTSNHDHAQNLVEQQEVEISRLSDEVKQLRGRLSFRKVVAACDTIEIDTSHCDDEENDVKRDQLKDASLVDAESMDRKKALPPESTTGVPKPPPRLKAEVPSDPAPRIPDSAGLAWGHDERAESVLHGTDPIDTAITGEEVGTSDERPFTPVLPVEACPQSQTDFHDGNFHQPPVRMSYMSQGLVEAVPNVPLERDLSNGYTAYEDFEERRTVALKRREKESFNVLPIWRMKKGFTKDMSPGILATRLSSFDSKDPDGFDSESNREGRDEHTKRLHILHPNCLQRGIWDISSLALVLYDMVVLPLQFFNPPETSVDVVMAWLTRLFWTCDIPMSCFTGYVTADGFVELRPNRILKRYASTWFLLDFFIVSVDWLEILMSATEGLGFAKFGKASRTFRIIRMLRLLRLARMRELIQIVLERINSEKVVIIADILKLTTLLLAFAHLIACVWFSIGDSDKAENWVTNFEYSGKSIGNQYAISLHWSVAQFAGGMDEITPENLTERLFAIIIFFFGFIAASVFVSSITSSMTQLSIIGSHQSQQLSALRRYLHQNGISNKLSVRVQRNAKYTVSEQSRSMPETQVTLLTHVSEPLRVEIHLEMYAPILMVHTFFSTYIEECPQVMRKVCHSATSVMMVSMGDVVFSAGEIPAHPKMYIVVHGVLGYRHGHTSRADALAVGKDKWLSEACLWTQWMHRGTLTAQSDVRVCVLDANKFQDIVGQFSHAHIKFDPRSYAREFVETLNNERDKSDLPFDFEDENDAPEISRMVSMIHLARTRTFYHSFCQWLRKLRQKRVNRMVLKRVETKGDFWECTHRDSA